MTALTSEKMDFTLKNFARDKTFYSDKRINSPERHNNYKHIHTKWQSLKIYETNIDKIEGENSLQ